MINNVRDLLPKISLGQKTYEFELDFENSSLKYALVRNELNIRLNGRVNRFLNMNTVKCWKFALHYNGFFIVNCPFGSCSITDGAKNPNATVNKKMQVEVLLLMVELVGHNKFSSNAKIFV